MTEPNRDPIRDALDAAVKVSTAGRRRCEISFEDFFRQHPPSPNYAFGKHTNAIIAALQGATDAIERGENKYLIINVPPRHGKSDICSRRFPAYHLCRNPEHEVILTTYSADLSEYMSRSARKCFEEVGPKYGLRLSLDQNQVGAWGLEDHKGALFAIGLGGTITGRGANVLLIDDYCKNRAEAESETIRNSVWDSFRSDLMTRLAPAHAVVILATRWHEDDLVGRIQKEMESDPKFPRFEVLNFPAQDEATGEYLFPERFPAEWYEAQKAAVGSYAWATLYQGNPQPRTGRLLRADLVKFVRLAEVPQLKLVRGWDLASSEKERISDNPDFTVGTKVGFDGTRLWIVDVVRGQWSAPKRDSVMQETARKDGRNVEVRIEIVAGYKDTFTRAKAALAGEAFVRGVTPHGDKVARASILEPIFEAGNVMVVIAGWNSAWVAELLGFPKGKKDDQVDSCVVASGELIDSRRRMKISF